MWLSEGRGGIIVVHESYGFKFKLLNMMGEKTYKRLNY